VNSHSHYADWKGWQERPFGECRADEALYFKAEVAKPLGTAHARILEIGFGNGGFLAWAKSVGYECAGIEDNPELVDKARRAGFEAFANVNELREKRGNPAFDAVVAFDVFEHIPFDRLESLFRDVRNLLPVGGLFVARFPNGDSPYGRAYQHGDPTHVTTLGQGMIRYLARRSRFEVARLKAPELPVRGVGLARKVKRLFVRSLRAIHQPAVHFLYYSGEPIVLTANTVAWLRATGTNAAPSGASCEKNF
jgi:hypothetical protein